MRRWLKLTQVQAKLFLREPVALFFTIFFPLAMLLLFGAIFGNEPRQQFGGFGYIDSQVPGLTAIIIGTVGLISIPIAVATARERKVLRRFKATPLPVGTLIGADVATHFVVTLIGMVILIVAALAIFGLRFGGSPLQVFLGVSLSSIAFFAIGYVLASVASTARTAQVLGQIIFFPSMFLSGATFPLQMMPEGVRAVSQFLPMTHVVRLLQQLWYGNPWDLKAVAVLGAMTVVGVVLSIRLFRWE